MSRSSVENVGVTARPKDQRRSRPASGLNRVTARPSCGQGQLPGLRASTATRSEPTARQTGGLTRSGRRHRGWRQRPALGRGSAPPVPGDAQGPWWTTFWLRLCRLRPLQRAWESRRSTTRPEPAFLEATAGADSARPRLASAASGYIGAGARVQVDPPAGLRPHQQSLGIGRSKTRCEVRRCHRCVADELTDRWPRRGLAPPAVP